MAGEAWALWSTYYPGGMGTVYISGATIGCIINYLGVLQRFAKIS